MEMEIIGLTKKMIVNLNPESLENQLLSKEEIVYIAKTLDSYWEYNYEVARQGKVGYHARLKSGRDSDGFFVSKILLQYPNILAIMANQLVLWFYGLTEFNKPDWAGGIPDGATELGKEVAKIMCVKNLEMKKENGRITLVSFVNADERVLLIEDFCTRGTGFKEAVRDIISKQPKIRFVPCELVIINRGGLKDIMVEEIGSFGIIAAAEHRVNDWDPTECPLCKMGSIPIKPKATDENWHLITTSQK